MKFKVVLADPPWHFQVWAGARKSGAGIACRATEPAYNSMIDDDLTRLPISEICEDDCVLFLWTCWPVLQRSFGVLEAWGFRYKTLGFDWVKCNSDGSPRMNLGYWTRANSEPCLLATRGKPKRMDKGVSQVIVSGLGEHSEKPEEQYARIERLVEGPYLELFHRPRNGLFPPREGWTFLGNEVDGKDMADALNELAQRDPCPPDIGRSE